MDQIVPLKTGVSRLSVDATQNESDILVVVQTNNTNIAKNAQIGDHISYKVSGMQEQTGVWINKNANVTIEYQNKWHVKDKFNETNRIKFKILRTLEDTFTTLQTKIAPEMQLNVSAVQLVSDEANIRKEFNDYKKVHDNLEVSGKLGHGK